MKIKLIKFSLAALLGLSFIAPYAPTFASNGYYPVGSNRVSSEELWSSVYGSYAYDPSFPSEFLKSVHVNDSEEARDKIYHISSGSFICNSKKAVSDFINKTTRSGEAYGGSNLKENAYPGCFYLYRKKSAVYEVSSSKVDGQDVVEIKFTLANQPPWRFGFYDNSYGHFAIYHGFTSDKLMANKLHLKAFIKKDKARFEKNQKHDMKLNSMPDKNNHYPVK